MKRIGIVITDGVGYRNFILSDFMIEAQKKFDHVVLLSCLPKEAYTHLDLECEIIELEVFQESFSTWFFRKTKEVAHLRLHRKGNFGIADNFKSNYSTIKNPRGYATRFIYQFTSWFHSEACILHYNRWQQYTFKQHPITKKYKQLLNELQLDSLFFTHQRPPYIAPLVFAAEQLQLKTTAFIFSWDNLASKGRMTANFDGYLVWSDLMKQELLTFYTSVLPEQVMVVGTPQFEPYVLERYKTTKQDFYNKFNLNPNFKTLCFSCGDISTSKNDELYIDLIANWIENNKLSEKVNFIVRTSPAEDGAERFKILIQKYDFIRWNFPKWILVREKHQEIWTQRIPTVEDIMDLRSVLEYSDLNVNMVSTMSIDFMIFEKPVIFPVFGNGVNGLYDDRRFLSYKHLVHVVESKSVKISHNEKELLESINKTIKNTKELLKEQNNLLKLEIGKPIVGTSAELVKALFEF